MELLARFGVFCITLVIYVIATLFTSAIVCVEKPDADVIPWIAWIIGTLAYAITMAVKWAF